MFRAEIAVLFLAATAAAQSPPPPSPVVPKAAAVTIFGVPPSLPSATAPVVIDPGKFILVTLNEYTGPVEWDISGDVTAVKRRPVKVGTLILATRQGTVEPDEYEVPAAAGATDFVRGVMPGTVRMVAWGVKDGRPTRIAELTIMVGPRPPPPVPPDPPTPPLPPGPVLTPFQLAVRAAVKLDTATPAQVALFASLYRSAAGGTVASAKTTGDVVDDLKSVVVDWKESGKLIHGSLDKTARVIEPELSKVINPPGAMDKDRRELVSAKLIEIATALEGAASGK